MDRPGALAGLLAPGEWLRLIHNAHRARCDWEGAEQRSDPETATGRIYHGLLRLVRIRQQNLAFSYGELEITHPGNEHVLGCFRHSREQNLLVLANFSEAPQTLAATTLRLLGLRKTFTDILAGSAITATRKLVLEPYQFMILMVGS